MTDVALRPVIEADVPALHQLDREAANRLGRTPPTEDTTRRFWLDGARSRVLAIIDGRVAGSGWTADGGSRFRLFGYTAADARGRGVGSTLLAWAAEAAVSRGGVETLEASGYLEEDAGRLLEDHGYAHVYTRWEFQPDDSATRPTLKIPDRITLSAPEPFTGPTEEYLDVFARSVPDADPQAPDDGDQFCVFAREGDTAVGFCHAHLDPDTKAASVPWIGVDPRARGHHVGRVLLRASVNELHDRGAATVTLTVDAANDAAVGLYRSEGFRRTGVQRSYERAV